MKFVPITLKDYSGILYIYREECPSSHGISKLELPHV